jgi:hypothetical protein
MKALPGALKLLAPSVYEPAVGATPPNDIKVPQLSKVFPDQSNIGYM